jgi:hypothetical protein
VKRNRGGLLDALQDQEESRESGEQLLAAGGATWRLRAAAVRRGWEGKTPAGSGEQRAGELEARWCGYGGEAQLAAREITGAWAAGGAAVKQRGRGERKMMRTYP